MSTNGTLTDMHTACLNRLAGAFLADACQGLSLDDKGYDEFPDPKFDVNGETIETDFLSVGVDDVQHYKIVGTKPIVDQDNGIIHDVETVESQLEEVAQFQEITPTSVVEFLSIKTDSNTPSIHEFVAVIPLRVYTEYKEFINDFCNKNGIIVWTASIGGVNKIKKVSGNHNVAEFNELLSGGDVRDGIYLHDVDSSIYPVVRESDMQLIKFIFGKRLITYSYHEQTTKIPYSDIDQIMLDGDRPILGHLSEDERDDYWQQCMLTLKTTLGVIKESRNEINVYEWTEERFLYDNSARSRLTEKIRSGLGIGEEA